MTELENEVMSLETAKLPIVQEFFKDKVVKFVWWIKDGKKNVGNFSDGLFLLEKYSDIQIYKTLTKLEMINLLPYTILEEKKSIVLEIKKGYEVSFLSFSEMNGTLEREKDFNKCVEKLFLWSLKWGYVK